MTKKLATRGERNREKMRAIRERAAVTDYARDIIERFSATAKALTVNVFCILCLLLPGGPLFSSVSTWLTKDGRRRGGEWCWWAYKTIFLNVARNPINLVSFYRTRWKTCLSRGSIFHSAQLQPVKCIPIPTYSPFPLSAPLFCCNGSSAVLAFGAGDALNAGKQPLAPSN